MRLQAVRTQAARWVVIALIGLISIFVACSPEPQPQPTKQVETTKPTNAACNTELELHDLKSISASLGYAFEPTFIPEGFEHSSASLDRRQRANLVYRNGQGIMLIAYPVTFYKQGSPTMVELRLLQPADAISEVNIGGSVGNVMRGSWSERTILAGPGINPADAMWDYLRSLTIYFDCETDQSEVVGVAIQSIPGDTGDLISEADLIQVASSMLRDQSSTQ
ncbi:MAG: hypothetical protein BZY79_01445 [SAR202 cluster bacterium Casp-Chloro-G4]|nr:hypothetical protein [Chloroflexota bacterium]MDA1227651.1 hypothetical protein [Chloroflexota bacterium]PKB61904.1 MAG: hypothetical protein BZY79_01445 [SAR202 cluster bacterium Casp-Chloro-G4]